MNPEDTADTSDMRAIFSSLPHHIGVAVRDIEKSIASLESVGVGPFRGEAHTKFFTVTFYGELRGKPSEFSLKVSNANMGGVELELLEPCQGDSAIKEKLDAQGEGLHHIGWTTSDLEGDIARAVARGARIWTSGELVRGRRAFVYFEPTEQGQVAIELREPVP